jgi:hypothetical protein
MFHWQTGRRTRDTLVPEDHPLKTGILLCCALFVLTARIAGAASDVLGDGAPSDSGQPQSIQLSDGTRLTFLGVTHGRQHVAPHYESLRTGNWIHTPGDTTVAWIQVEHESGRWPNYELLISDKANSACVATVKETSSQVKNGVDVQGFVLNAFPRWDNETILRVRPFRGAIAAGQFVVTNAAHGAFADWTFEPLPDTKSDGDFEVTLTNMVAGMPMPRRRGGPVPDNDPANQCVRLAFGFQQNGQSATNWRPWLVQTSDPAGNRVKGLISDYPQDGIYAYPQPGNPQFGQSDGYFFRPGLWPAESPWKVRLEFTRKSGFNDDEVLTLTNLPVRAGTQQYADDEWTWDASNSNITFTPASVNGVRLKLLQPLLVPDRFQPGKQHLSVIIYADPNPTLQGMRLTLLQATDDQGRAVVTPFSPDWAGHFSLDFPNAPDIKTLNLKLALHKSRFVEFTVKPSMQ